MVNLNYNFANGEIITASTFVKAAIFSTKSAINLSMIIIIKSPLNRTYEIHLPLVSAHTV